MSKPRATPDAELVMPWETAEERETVETAESSLFELLGSDPEFAEDPRERGQRETEDEDPENKDGPPREEYQEEEDSLEGADSEEDDLEEYEDEEDSEFGDEDEDDDLYVVKVDGEEIEVPLEELKAGYSRTEYMTRTRQKEAGEHRQAMAAVQAAQQEYATKLELMEQALEQLNPAEPDWEQVQRDNPTQFGAIFAAHQKRAKVREAVLAEKQAEAEKAAEAAAEAQSAYTAEQFELLTQAVPEWKKDGKRMANDIKEITAFAQGSLGFTEQELQGVNDHRVILALQMAKRGFELERGGKKILRKKKRSRTLKPSGEKRGRTPRGNRRRNSRRLQKRADRVAQTGSVMDAADLFKGMLEDGADL